MKNINFFLMENFQFLEVKFSIYLNRCVFVMFCYVGASTIIVKIWSFAYDVEGRRCRELVKGLAYM